MFLIMIFILIINIVAILLIYHCLESMEKREKIVFIAIGVTIIYILTSFVYWISTKDIEIKEVAEQCKNLITFMFVPVNAICVLPILAKSYRKYKMGKLETSQFRNRGIVLAILLVILLVIELSYFKDIQREVVKAIEKNQEEIQKKDEATQSYINIIMEQQNSSASNEIVNSIVNEMDTIIVNEEVVSNDIISTNVMELNENSIETNIID